MTDSTVLNLATSAEQKARQAKSYTDDDELETLAKAVMELAQAVQRLARKTT
ncbi:MAG: hypothetical protein JWP19_2216 [Rhodoglobus sp.]|nr:hypothetical protein [Rhodoglobus sp.]